MVMLCRTAETRSKERPNRYIHAKKIGIYFLEAFPTSTTFKPTNRSVLRTILVPRSDVPGGRLCFSFSAFSLSSSDSV